MNSSHQTPHAPARRTPPVAIRLLLLLGLVLAQSACSGTDSTAGSRLVDTDPLANVPRDFQLDVRILVGRRVGDRDRLERRDVHIVLLPDGALHAATGEQVRAGSRPGLARVLYRGQVADVWALMNQLEFIGAGEPITGPVRAPGASELVYVVEYTHDNARRRIEQRFIEADARENATTELVRSLGAIAWLRDRPVQDSTVEPLRYDFGPDPWARYRTVDETASE